MAVCRGASLPLQGACPPFTLFQFFLHPHPKALLEERQRSRVDLQPLLHQLCSQLAVALPRGGGGGARLSAARQACMQGEAGGTDASMQVREGVEKCQSLVMPTHSR